MTFIALALIAEFLKGKLSQRRLGVTPQAIGRYFDQCLDPSVTTMSVGSGS